MNQKILHTLKTDLEYMSRVERSIASVILSDPKSFPSYSLSAFSNLTKVSQGSIVNFSKKYCQGGFSALKLAVATCAQTEEEQPFSAVKSSDSLKSILQSTATDLCDALKNTLALNEEATLKAAAELILNAKKTEIYGIFRSAVVATDFYFRLLELGVPATFVSDVLTCAVSASLLGKGDVVVAISSSGQTKDVIDAVKLAKSNGVSVITVTAHKGSPLSQLSDHVLIAAPSGNSLSANANEIRLSQLAITDTLCSYLQSKLDCDGSNRYYKMEDILKLHSVKD